MGRNLIETVMGAVVLLVAAGFLFFAFQSSNMRPVEGYTLMAKFEGVGGVTTGSDVRIGGIKIGVISDMQLDPDTYQAIVKMQIKEGVKIPTDSNAAIVGDGLLGSKYVSIEPGAEEKMLANNGEIKFTQSSVSLETLIGKFMFSGEDKKGDDADRKPINNSTEEEDVRQNDSKADAASNTAPAAGLGAKPQPVEETPAGAAAAANDEDNLNADGIPVDADGNPTF